MRSQIIQLRMPTELVEKIDEFGKGKCMGRADKIRQLVAAALEQKKQLEANAA